MLKTIADCLKFAISLDNQGLYRQADKFDEFVYKFANKFPDEFATVLSKKQKKRRKKSKSKSSGGYGTASSPNYGTTGYVGYVGNGDSGDGGGDGGGA